MPGPLLLRGPRARGRANHQPSAISPLRRSATVACVSLTLVSRPYLLQGIAAGLMLCISVFDLFPEAQEEIGFAQANLWFFAGVLFFAVIVKYIPEPPSEMVVVDEGPEPEQEAKHSAAAANKEQTAEAVPPTPSRYSLRSRSHAAEQSAAEGTRATSPVRQRKGRM